MPSFFVKDYVIGSNGQTGQAAYLKEAIFYAYKLALTVERRAEPIKSHVYIFYTQLSERMHPMH